MKRINSLNDLLMEELADLWDAEDQLAQAFPKMIELSQSLALKLVLENHLEVTKGHADRLEDIFNNARQRPQKAICKIMKNIIRESEDLAITADKGPGRDAAIISIAQRIERYEIDGYSTAREHAIDLGQAEMVEILDATLNEEREMHLNLSELAQYMINVQAIDPTGSYQSDRQGPSEIANNGFHTGSRFIK